MLKRFLSVLFFAASVSAWTQSASSLYAGVSPAVVYLRHEVLLDPALARYPELISRLEREWERPLLSSYFTLSSGSGFFVDPNGTILTNRHVVELDDIDKLRQNSATQLARQLERMGGGQFSPEELRRLKVDFFSMITKGAYRFSATAGNAVIVPVDRVFTADKDDPDVALVRVPGSGYPTLPFAAPEEVDARLVGADVFSFGYPLGATMDEAFKDRVVTMNRGTVSAIRNDKLGIQHSAAISGGNSGGPLVDARGVVVGINTAHMTEGQSLYYAVGADLIQRFLGSKGFGGLLRSGGGIPGAITSPSSSGGLRLNRLGEIESSADIMIDAEKGAEVYFGATLVGTAPLISVLVDPVTNLEIKGRTGTFSGKIRLLKSLSGLTTVKPDLVPYMVDIEVTSEPSGAEILENGKSLGKTPMRFSTAAGVHTLGFALEGYHFDSVSFEAERFLENRVQGVGNALVPVSLISLSDSASARLYFRSGIREYHFKGNDKMALPSGDWLLSVSEVPSLNGVEIPVNVRSSPVQVDLAPYKKRGSLAIEGIGASTRIWVDGRELPRQAASPLSLPLGKNTVYIWEDGFAPLPETVVTVMDRDTEPLVWGKTLGSDIKARRFAWTGVALGTVGAIVAGAGWYYNRNDVAIAASDSYSEYRDQKALTANIAIAGCSMLAVSAITELIALRHWRTYKAQRAYLDRLSQ